MLADVRRFRVAGAALAGLLLPLAAAPLAAQDIAGDYDVDVGGWTYHLDRTPERREVQDATTLTVEQEGSRITVLFRSFASAMSTTRFRGRVGNGRFVATGTSSDGATRVIKGRVQNGTLRGELLYPRGGADAAVPGWTEVRFRAVPADRSDRARSDADSGFAFPFPNRPNASRPPPRAREVPPGLAPGGDESAKAAFAADLTTHVEPGAPVAGQRVTVTALAEAPPGESVERTEIWMDGMLQGSSEGRRVEATVGPFEPGAVHFDVVAISDSGTRSERHRVTTIVRPSGSSVIRGRIEGRKELIVDVQLLSTGEELVGRAELDGQGRFRFERVPRGRYYLFVNDGRSEAMVSPSSTVEIAVDGRSTYRRDFTVR